MKQVQGEFEIIPERDCWWTVWDDERAFETFARFRTGYALVYRVGELLGRGNIPEDVPRKGRMTAFQKSGGGIRGIVVSGKAVEGATAPFQYALSTKAGCECVAHLLQALSELNTEADWVSAYDLISRRAMLTGLAGEGGAQVLQFVNMFYGRPSILVGGFHGHSARGGTRRRWRTG